MSDTIQELDHIVETSDDPKKPAFTVRDGKSGFIFREEWHEDGIESPLHRDGGPALILRSTETGAVTWEGWYQNGKEHREDGPAIILYHEGGIGTELWYLRGKKHRENGPAAVSYFNGVTISEEYHQHGLFHRLDGPALIWRNPDNGLVYREAWSAWGSDYRADGGPTSRLYNPETGILRRETFHSVAEMPTRARALRRELSAWENVTYIELAP
ncbi:MAG: hypothetical protein WDM81_19535 [Rhizomicrobium sp.]